jgi:hypothetical protein
MEAAAPPPAAPQPQAAPPARRIDVGNVISETFSQYGSHFGTLIGAAVVIFGITGLINAFLYDEGGIIFNLIINALNVVASTIYAGMVVRVVQHARQGTSASVGEMFESVMPVLLPLIVNGFLKGIAVAIGFILLIVPGIFLATIWAVTGPAIVVERAGIIDAFGRSWDLVRGQFWSVLGAYVIAYLILIAATIVAGVIGISIGLVGLIVMMIILSVLVAPILALVSAIIFFDLGGGQTAAAPAAPAQPPPPPAAPAA